MVTLPRASPDDTAWPVVTVDRLGATVLRALLDNRVAAVRRPGLLDERACAESIAALRRSDAWDSYDIEGPATGKLGISQYAYGERKETYFADAAVARAQRTEALAEVPDPLELVLAELADAWDGPVGLAAEGGRAYFAGVLRSGSGIRLHADWAPRDGPGWTIENVVAQLAWNMYYAVPETGGELQVYDRPWSPDLELGARQHFYDYDAAAVAGCRRVEIALSPGDLVVFSSSNVHAVADAPDTSTRIAVSSFVGERPDGSLVLWS